MMVDDLDISRTLLGPHKADAPLVVDSDRMVASLRDLEIRETCPVSCAGLTRASLLLREMDCRVKPGNDGERPITKGQ
jgi:hypothetical protein